MARSVPRLAQLNLVVTDMATTLAFYRRLGVVVDEPSPEWAAHHCAADGTHEIRVDFDSVAFAKVWDEAWDETSHRAGVLGFQVDSREDVDAIYDDLLAAGYAGELAPHDTFFGARYAIVLDPDRQPVGIMSPKDPAMRRAQDPPG